MSHYISRRKATELDQLALDRIKALDGNGLYRVVHDNKISMCGVIPVTVAIQAVQKLGGTTGRLVEYTDSGAVSGDIHQVVGYAGALLI